MKFKLPIKDQNGFTLIWVIITMLVMLILGFAIITVSIAETNHAARSERKIQTDYIARSGVEHGFQLLLNVPQQEEIDDIIEVANNLAIQDHIFGNGSYSISFSQDGEAYVVIESIAKHATNSTIESKVSLYVPIEMISVSSDMEWEEAPRSWKRADNLWGGIFPDSDVDVDLTGKGIVFTGAPTKSPQNSSDPSTFRATVMLFRGRDNKDVTFQQQKNTNNISFDAEVLIFEGNIRLRDDNREVKLNITNKVTDPTNGFLDNWSYSSQVGFENFDRYLDFIGLAGKSVGDPEYDDALALYELYEFENGTDKYGLVYFDGSINKDGIGGDLLTSGNGVYFFKNGVDLNDPPYTIGTTAPADLIIVDENDPIREQRENKQGDIYFIPSPIKQFYSVE